MGQVDRAEWAHQHNGGDTLSPRARSWLVLLANPQAKVRCMTVVLAAVVAILTLVMLDHRAPAPDSAIPWWGFAIAFAVTEVAVAHIEIRRESVTLSLSEAVLLVGLVHLAPVGLALARVVGGLLAVLLRGTTVPKFVFNGALFAFEAVVAATIVHLVFRIDDRGPWTWAGAGFAVLIAALASVAAVTIVISFFEPSRSVRLLRSALVVQAVIATASISLAVLGYAAATADPSNIAYLVLLLIGIVLLLRRDASTAQRAADLESIGEFTATLVALTTTKDVVEVSLREVARTLRANRAALLFPKSSRVPVRAYSLETDEVRSKMPFDFEDLIGAADQAALLDEIEVDGTVVRPHGVFAPISVGDDRGVLVAWERTTNVSQFLRRDPPTLQAMADQVRVALERSALIDRLHYDAHHDALTELPNRLGFSAMLSDRPPLCGALFVLDLDRFKDINDTLGHPTGDAALQIIAERLRHAVGTDAALARLGGDEFAVFSWSCVDAESASAFAEYLATVTEAPVRLEDLSMQIGVSIGIALAPAHGTEQTALMSRADTAMYEAKANHSRHGFYRPETDTNDPRRLELVGELRRVLDQRELDVWYQPKINLADGSVDGAEALARWEHARFGWISPDEFIGLAEGAGLIRELTNVVLERAISDVRTWRDHGIDVRVSVNLSTRNLLDDTLMDAVTDTLMTHDVDAAQLSFEITETAIMVDRERVVDLLRRFRAAGISVAIDDYGTGYSSLAYLRELPVDELKIDRSFVTDIDLLPHNEVIVKSTIEMAHNLGLSVVAEGMERAEELAMLRRLGCDSGQGYLISKPRPMQEVTPWLIEQLGSKSERDREPHSAAIGPAGR